MLVGEASATSIPRIKRWVKLGFRNGLQVMVDVWALKIVTFSVSIVRLIEFSYILAGKWKGISTHQRERYLDTVCKSYDV